VDEGRISAMDAAGIDMQVLSLNAPGVEQAFRMTAPHGRSRGHWGPRCGGASRDCSRVERLRCRGREEASGAVRCLRRPTDRGSRAGGGRTGPPRPTAGLQGDAH
jgi:hypothetical protein